jgi:hypothetical protein
MGQLAVRINDLRMDDLQETLLNRAFLPHYHQLIEKLSPRCAKGDERMKEIGQTLGQIATWYEEGEELHAQRIRDAGTGVRH